MHPKTLLSVTGVDHNDEDLIGVAELAHRERASLVAIVISCVPPPPVAERAGDISTLYAVAWEQEYDRLNARVAELAEMLASRGLRGDLRAVYCLQGSVAEEVAKHASYADMTVVGRTMRRDEFLLKRVLDGALFSSPAPVLLLEGSDLPTLRPKNVLIAWNATLEAGTAVRGALDIIAHADKAHLALVDPDARPYTMGEEPGADMATFLAKHQANVTVSCLASGGVDPALVLQRHAKDVAAELIIMGAYGHSRLRERIFGGTTESMMQNIATPVLMAH